MWQEATVYNETYMHKKGALVSCVFTCIAFQRSSVEAAWIDYRGITITAAAAGWPDASMHLSPLRHRGKRSGWSEGLVGSLVDSLRQWPAPEPDNWKSEVAEYDLRAALFYEDNNETGLGDEQWSFMQMRYSKRLFCSLHVHKRLQHYSTLLTTPSAYTALYCVPYRWRTIIVYAY